jgi:hypothetical protein
VSILIVIPCNEIIKPLDIDRYVAIDRQANPIDTEIEVLIHFSRSISGADQDF